MPSVDLNSTEHSTDCLGTSPWSPTIQVCREGIHGLGNHGWRWGMLTMACILASLSLATSSLTFDGSHMQLCAALTVWTAVAHILGSHSVDNWFGSTCRETYLSEFIPRGDYWSYTVQWALYYTCDVCHVRTLVWQSTASAFSRTHRHIRWAIFFGRCSDPGLAKYFRAFSRSSSITNRL